MVSVIKVLLYIGHHGNFFIAANHERLLSCDPSLLAVVSMVTKLDCSATANCNFLCLWILAQLSVGSEWEFLKLHAFVYD